jgi:hypothetical protein
MTAAWIQVKIVDQVSSPVTICNNQPSPQVSYWCNTSVVTAFFLSLCTCHHLWHPVSADLGIASSAITAITLPLPMDRVEYSSSVVVGQLSFHPPSRCCEPSVQWKWGHSAVCDGVLLLLFQLLWSIFHHQIALTSTAASPYTWSKCWWIQDGSSPTATKALPLFVSSEFQSLPL